MKAHFQIFGNKEGATAVTVAILIVVLVGSAALALDIGHLAVVRNELQNAADAGALAGARVLYALDESGQVTGINPDAKEAARTTAIANFSDKSAVEVDLATDVQTGNWDGTTFTPSTSGNETDLTYVNAIRVTAHRSAAYSILAGIFGYSSFPALARATAYRGYAGTNVQFDMPIAICQDMISDGSTPPKYTCNTGRMFSNGGGSSTIGTARWTNFSEDCANPASAGSISGVVNLGCSTGIMFDSMPDISSSEGEVTPALTAVYNCWAPNAPVMPTTSWEITLPVVKCVQPSSCSQIVGSVKVKVVWITKNGTDSHYNNIPRQMDDWSASVNCSGLDLGVEANRITCWNNFATHFNLKYRNSSGDDVPATYQPATLYFLPSCDFKAAGGPGGVPSDIFSLIPKLVE